jgi:hypothetical protein
MLSPVIAGYLFQAGWGLAAVAQTMGIGSLLAAVTLVLLRVPPRVDRDRDRPGAGEGVARDGVAKGGVTN